MLLRGHKYFINYINIGVWYYCIYILTDCAFKYYSPNNVRFYKINKLLKW